MSDNGNGHTHHGLLRAVFCTYCDVPFTKDGITSTKHELHFEKIHADGCTVPADPAKTPGQIVKWLKEQGFIECGCTVGEAQELGVVWIASAEYHTQGIRPEDFSRILGRSLRSATVGFFHSENGQRARLEGSNRTGTTKRLRAANPSHQGDFGVRPLPTPEQRARAYGLA